MILGGRILVYDAETGRLRERVEPLEFRVYHSILDEYDALPPLKEREVHVDDHEYRPDYLGMRVDLKTEEIWTGICGLFSEWRELNTYIYAAVDGEEILLAKQLNIRPRSGFYNPYLEPGVADLFLAGKEVQDIRIDSYYADTGEFYDSIPGEIIDVFASD